MGSLAVGFSGNSIRFAGLSEDRQLSHISELETDFDFDNEIPAHHGDDHLISELASVICENLKKVENISSSTVSLVINTMQMFSNVMPLEVEEDEQVTSSNILWDTSIYFPEEYENFNINYYRLKKLSLEDSEDNIYNVLVLGINRNIINFYRRIFDECGLKIDLFDSDHSAVSGLVSDLDDGNSTYGLLGLKPGRIDLSINQNDEIKYFDYSYTGSFDFKRELDKDLTTLELDDNFEKVKTIYIYGESLLESVKEYLEQKYEDREIKILDPLEKYANDSSTDSILHFSSAARFAPLFGLALKSLEQE